VSATVEEFRKDFLETVKARAAADHNFTLSAFVDSCVDILIEAGELADFQPSHFRGFGRRQRSLWIDGYAFDEADGSIRLLVADWHGGDSAGTLTLTDARAIFGRLRAFIDDARAGHIHEMIDMSSEVADLARMLYDRRAVTRFRLYLVTDALLSERVRAWPEEHIADVAAEFHIWDVARLERVSQSQTGREELDVNFEEYQRGGIPCLQAGLNSEDYKAYLCVLPGRVVGELYTRYGRRLLEGNVRSFLSIKGKINKGLKTSLQNEPEMFFAYNNGIAATATTVEITEGRLGLFIKRARDLQIVNGGQTTVSLANALADPSATDLERAFVQMKLSVVPSQTAGDVIPLIAKYANSQNRVSDADFFSNHDFHRRMEQISRRLWAPAIVGAQHETHWFYERTRGQFQQEQARMLRSERVRFLAKNPRRQLITKTDLAKTENTFRELPHVVSLGAQKNFLVFARWVSDEWDKNNANFNDEYFRRAIVKTLLFRTVERLVSDQEWYQGGYRANIVTYTLAKLAALMRSRGSTLDYEEYWSKQQVSVAMERQLALIAKHVFDVLVSPPSSIQNVTEWAKKEACWSRVESTPMTLFREVLNSLISTDVDRNRRGEARGAQKELNRISAQIEVVQLGSAYWSELLEWGRTRRTLNGEQERLLELASRLPGLLPTERQSLKLLNIRNVLVEEGFRREKSAS
jgi:hypothetical protein